MLRDPIRMTKIIRNNFDINGTSSINLNCWGPMIYEFVEKEYRKKSGRSQTHSCPNVNISWFEKEIETVTRKKIRSGSLSICQYKCQLKRKTLVENASEGKKDDFGNETGDVNEEVEKANCDSRKDGEHCGSLVEKRDVSTQTFSKKEVFEITVSKIIDRATFLLKDEINKAIERKFEPIKDILENRYYNVYKPISDAEEEEVQRKQEVQNVENVFSNCILKEKKKVLFADIIPTRIQEIYFNNVNWTDCQQKFESEKLPTVGNITRGTNTGQSMETAFPNISESDVGSLQGSCLQPEGDHQQNVTTGFQVKNADFFVDDHSEGTLSDMNKFLYIVLETLRRLSEERKNNSSQDASEFNLKIAPAQKGATKFNLERPDCLRTEVRRWKRGLYCAIDHNKLGQRLLLEKNKDFYKLTDKGILDTLPPRAFKKILKYRRSSNTDQVSSYPLRLFTSPTDNWAFKYFDKDLDFPFNGQTDKKDIPNLNLPHTLTFGEEDWLLSRPVSYLNNLKNNVCQTCMTKTIDSRLMVMRLNDLKTSENIPPKSNFTNHHDKTKGYVVKYKPNRNFSQFKIRNEFEYLNLRPPEGKEQNEFGNPFQQKGLYKCYVRRKFFSSKENEPNQLDNWINENKYKKYLLESSIRRRWGESSVSVLPMLFKISEHYKKSSGSSRLVNCGSSRLKNKRISLENTFLSVNTTHAAREASCGYDSNAIIEDESAKCILKKLFNWNKNSEKLAIENHLKNIYTALYTDKVSDQVYKSVMVISQMLRNSSEKKKELIVTNWLEICEKKNQQNRKTNFDKLFQTIGSIKQKVCHLTKCQSPPEQATLQSLPPNTATNIREMVIKKYAKEIINYIADPKCIKINIDEYKYRMI